MKLTARAFTFTVLIVFLLLFSACGEDSPLPSPSESPSQSPTDNPSPTTPIPSESVSPSPTEPIYSGVNPLTGQGMDKEYEDERPVAVMYNNLKAALPQHGVSKADIIYECVVEGGITRMIALFKDPSNLPDNFGSIRSTRAYFLDIAQGHDAILIHAGGSPEAYSEISKRKITNLDGITYDGIYYHRDSERRRSAGYEHSMFITSENLTKMIKNTKVRSTHKEDFSLPLTFADNAVPVDGEKAVTIELDFSRYKKGLFEYDADSSLYMVSQNGDKYIDGETDDQVGVTNVLVLYVKYSNIAGDDAGRLRAGLTGSGEGFFACGGKAVPITWEKETHASPFVYKLKDGSPLVLGKGSTYINVFPANRTASYK